MNTPLPAKPHSAALYKQPVWRWALLAVLGAGILIVLASSHFYATARNTANADLDIIAQLKAHETERWLQDKRSGMIQPASGNLALSFATWQETGPGPEQDVKLRETLAFYQRRHHETERIDLYDTQGRFVISSDLNRPSAARLPAADSPHGAQAALVDFYLNPAGQPRLAFITPLTLAEPAGPRAIGYALLELNPLRYFYPALQAWPMHNASGEVVLIRPHGDVADVLTPALSDENALTVKLDLRKAQLSAAQLESQGTVFAPGLDYRDIEVLRAIHPVNDSPWKITTKIDADEVYADALRQSLTFALLLIALLATLIYLLRQGHLQALHVARAAQDQSAAQRLSAFIEAVPESLLMLHRSGEIKIINHTAATRLGSTPEVLIGSNLFDRLPAPRAAVEQACTGSQPASFDNRRNGTDYQAMLYPLGDGQHAVVIATDITARLAAETALRESEKALREGEEQLRNIAANLPASVLYQTTLEADGYRHFSYVSASAERILGVSAEAMRADMMALISRIDPEHLPALRQVQADALDGGDVVFDFRLRLLDDQWRWIAMRSRQREGLSTSGRRVWDGSFTDITKIKTDELQLTLHARRASALLDLPKLAEQLDETAFLAQAQEIAEDLTGSQIAFVHFVNEDQESIELAAWSRNTLAHYCTAAYDKHYPISKAGIWADAARHKVPVVINDYAIAPGKRGLPEGHSHLQRLISVPVLEGGVVRMLAGVGNKATDYTDTDVESVQLIASEAWRILRKQRAETALAQTVQVIEASPVVCFRWRPEEGWPVAYVSDNVRRWGYTPAELLDRSRSFASLIHPEDLARVGEEVSQYIAKGINEFIQEYRLLRSDGTAFWISDATILTREPDGTLRHIDGVINDISERKAYELQLAEKLVAEQALNEKLEEAHNQLLQTEKLAAIGQLAAGVAHELNNPIGFVHSNLGTLTEYVTALISLCDTYTTLFEDTEPDFPQLAEIRRIKQDQDYNYLRSDIFPLLEESREGLARVRKIVQDLRDFSRTGSQEWVLADLHKGLESTLNIVANELKYKCTIRKEYAELPEVYCVISQINQVFMNLLVNAAQAIETEGEIVLRSGLQGDDQVWISISDSGSGIAPDKLNHIFEPFFTTKPVGVGTGLGLSLVFGIIKRHHGRIEVNSEPGKGTTFRILLPINQPASPEAV